MWPRRSCAGSWEGWGMRTEPASWGVLRLDELADCYAGGTPSRALASNFGGGIPWVKSGEVNADEIQESEETISLAGLSNSSARWVPPDTPLIAMYGATAGQVSWLGIRATTNQAVLATEPSLALADARWLFWALKRAAPQMLASVQGSGQPNLSKTALEAFRLAHPPLPEQRQIAAILDTIDDAIRKTEQIIAKLKQVKQGLLHDLLTRGIDDNGELRDPERHPEQFKDSPLGRIPREWEATRLGSHLARCGGFLQTGPFGSQLHSYEYSAVGVPVVMPQDISDDGVSTKSVARIPERVASRLARHRMKSNDLVFARRGDLSRCAPIGTRELEWICGTGCLLARLPEHALDAEWLAASYRHDTIQRQVAARAVGSTMVNLNTEILQSLVLPVPSGEEQRRISMVARTHRLRVAEEAVHLAKLRLLKSGLMEDLLTGRVRVTKLLESAAE
ncbi:MAG: restriction endonuclease subunit S [Polyangiaceae bacterium]|nr:restriction endonuclease subunit S [Polyangiaceae bacterium]